MTYKYKAWVHPEAGGDDFLISGKVMAPNRKIAKKEIELLLKLSGSAITNDFTMKGIKRGKDT